jgi:hypothetical protein
MEHVVFSAAEGGAGEEFRRVSSLEEAIRVVEHLRNDLGVTEAAVYALTPVPVTFRAYYHVEVPGAEPVAGPRPLLDAASNVEEADPADLGLSPMAPPSLLPPVSTVPASRSDGEAEHSLGYFAR